MYFLCKDKNQVKTCDEHFSKVQTVAIGKDHIVEVVGLCNGDYVWLCDVHKTKINDNLTMTKW